MPRLSKIGAAALAAFGWTGGASISASYLVVAGGGGASSNVGAGAGAGGYRTGTTSLNPTLSYTITVGAGGIGGATGSANNGTNGSDSIFSSITSTGGGRTNFNAVGSAGGSGGGGWPGSAGGAGNTPSTSPSQGNNGGSGASSSGGGGGASAVGADGSVGGGGAGGNGSASSISGLSVTYAGGGGGTSATTGAAGGSGGGGAGGANTLSGTNGTANLGGGGGGGGNNNGAGGSGGSGVVIISYPAPQQFGGGVVTTSGSNVIHTFNTSGTLSPLSSLTASYLIVAGGSAGGGTANAGANAGGGGGAGGLLSGSGVTIDSNSTYLVTVGAGAAGTTSQSTNGSNSTFSMVTTTAIGGGAGGSNSTGVATYINGLSGGSGGGGSTHTTSGTGGAGTAGQGNAGGNGLVSAPNYPGGGGGGAGAVGTTAPNGSTAGAGGVGLSSTISGTTTFYAGGGGGATYGTGGTAGAGGNGGGGAGANNTGVGTAGTAGTGGGGGGSCLSGTANQAGGNGGSGVVIISYAGSTQQMAGGTVTISGGNVIHTFTSSGYLTPIKYVNNSLRFRSSASAYLSRTPATAGNQKTWTLSLWVKRGILSGALQKIFEAGATSANYLNITWNGTGGGAGSDQLDMYANVSSAMALYFDTTSLYRDPSAWYHVVVAVDTTQATSTNRVKMYVNGAQLTAFASSTYPTQNTNLAVNGNVAHAIGNGAFVNGSYLDGYLTEINFVDGQALTPNSFGTFNSYGVWQPITYGGSYGTNGFYLPFTNKTSTTTLGYDFSPNGNNWTTNNISLTAGSTYDSMTDVPTLTSATAANYATWNPLAKGSDVSTAAGNLEASWSGVNGHCIMATIALPQTGKWKCEITGVYQVNFGITPIATQKVTEGIGTTVGYGYRGTDGQKVINGSYSAYGATYGTSDVITLLYDADALILEFKKNNSSQGTISVASNTYVVGVGYQSPSAGTAKINFGQYPFTYTDSAYLGLNTYNL